MTELPPIWYQETKRNLIGPLSLLKNQKSKSHRISQTPNETDPLEIPNQPNKPCPSLLSFFPSFFLLLHLLLLHSIFLGLAAIDSQFKYFHNSPKSPSLNAQFQQHNSPPKMIVRTYGRRNRGGIPRTYSDSLNDIVHVHDDDSDEDVDEQNDLPFKDSSLSQDHSLYSFNFSSQESSSHSNCTAFESAKSNGVARRPLNKKPKKANGSCSFSIPATSTLMEAQEFGEMMEHVDEVNFALDGLRKPQPVRIRRASLLSLLSICATVQQRRLLRTQGYVHVQVFCNGFSLIVQFWICVMGFQLKFDFFFLRTGVWIWMWGFADFEFRG